MISIRYNKTKGKKFGIDLTISGTPPMYLRIYGDGTIEKSKDTVEFKKFAKRIPISGKVCRLIDFFYDHVGGLDNDNSKKSWSLHKLKKEYHFLLKKK